MEKLIGLDKQDADIICLALTLYRGVLAKERKDEEQQNTAHLHDRIINLHEEN